ncbi:hypothetical protein STENM223S_10734 [Streptomyces tendae]
MRSRDLADRVPAHEVRAHAPGFQQPEQRDLDREQRRLRPLRTPQTLTVLTEDDVLQLRTHARAHRVEGLREHRERLIQLTPHPRTLRTLPREQERSLARPWAPSREDVRRRLRPGQRLDGGRTSSSRSAPTTTARSRSGRRGSWRAGGHASGRPSGRVGEVVGQAGGPGRAGTPRARAERTHGERGRAARGSGATASYFLGRRLRGLLDDDVGVGAAHAEGGDAGTARVGRSPASRCASVRSRTAAGVPVDVRWTAVRRAGCGGSNARARRASTNLMTPTTPAAAWVWPRFDFSRAEPQRPVGGAALAVGGEQRLRLDGVAERGAGAVRLDGVDLGGGEPGVGQGGADDALLGRAVGGGQTVGGAVLVDGAAAHDREHRVAVAAGVGQPFHDEHADALGPAGAVGAVGERLAAAVPGETALAAELAERAGVDITVTPPADRQGALARPQGLRGQVQGDQGGGTGGVDGDGGPLQAEGVGDPAGEDAVELPVRRCPRRRRAPRPGRRRSPGRCIRRRRRSGCRAGWPGRCPRVRGPPRRLRAAGAAAGPWRGPRAGRCRRTRGRSGPRRGRSRRGGGRSRLGAGGRGGGPASVGGPVRHRVRPGDQQVPQVVRVAHVSG